MCVSGCGSVCEWVWERVYVCVGVCVCVGACVCVCVGVCVCVSGCVQWRTEGGGLGCSNPPPPRNSEDIGGVLDRMSKKNRRLDFL